MLFRSSLVTSPVTDYGSLVTADLLHLSQKFRKNFLRPRKIRAAFQGRGLAVKGIRERHDRGPVFRLDGLHLRDDHHIDGAAAGPPHVNECVPFRGGEVHSGLAVSRGTGAVDAKPCRTKKATADANERFMVVASGESDGSILPRTACDGPGDGGAPAC